MNNTIKHVEGAEIDSRFESIPPPIFEITFNPNPKITIHSDGEPYVEFDGQLVKKQYLVCWYVFDIETNRMKYIDANIIVGQPKGGFVWYEKPYTKYHNWYIVVKHFYPSHGFVDLYEHSYNVRGKNVTIHLDSTDKEEVLSWLDVIKDFKILHGCNILATTYVDSLRMNSYDFLDKNLQAYGSIRDDTYASYTIKKDSDKHSTVEIAKNTLGLLNTII
jgi:hypothetical protein